MNKKLPAKQQGAALIVSLIMLTVLTLLGVSNMSSSTLDLKMAINSRAHYNSFQAAYSAIEAAVSDATIDYTDDGEDAVFTTRTDNYKIGENSDGDDITASVAVTITGADRVSASDTLGNSISGVGGDFILRQIIATGTSGTSNSLQVQGVKQRVAGS